MVKLLVSNNYRNREVSYRTGEVIEVTDERARFLMADAPGCFAVPGQVKAEEAPPKDKMLRRKVTK